MPITPTLTGRKYALFAMIAVSLSLALTVGCLAAAELSLHWRYGMNLWGYRGPSLGRKQPGEARIAVLGGSTAWGYGVAWDEAFPYYLAQELTARRRQHPPVHACGADRPCHRRRDRLGIGRGQGARQQQPVVVVASLAPRRA